MGSESKRRGIEAVASQAVLQLSSKATENTVRHSGSGEIRQCSDDALEQQ